MDIKNIIIKDNNIDQIENKNGNTETNEDINNFLEKKENNEEECSICLDTMKIADIKTLQCGHSFHLNCLKQLINFHCPLCRTTINIKKTFNITEKICQDGKFHYGVGYAPYCENGPCRFCFGKPLSFYLKN